MFYDEKQALIACEEDPSLIFELMKEGHFSLVERLLKQKRISVAEVDQDGNTVLMKLLKLRQYKMVLTFMKYKDFDVNHQNKEGNTFAHILSTKDYAVVGAIIKELKNNREFYPNLKNNEGKTILDIAIESNHLCTAFKILEDKRFNNIDVMSFLSLYKRFVKSNDYGKYTKLSNLSLIINNLSKKTGLLPKMERLIQLIKEGFEQIKQEMMKNKMTYMDQLIHSVLLEVGV